VTTILLARHGETDWNVEGRWQGHADPPLNARGREQAEALAERLVDTAFDAIYSSDLARAKQTAEIVARRLGLPVTTDRGLREIDVGSWSGLTRADIAVRFPDGERPDGEHVDAFRARVLSALERLAAGHDGRRILVVAHGGCVRTLQRHMLGEPLPTLENCGVYPVSFQGGLFSPID